jgi:serine/threonine protein kinase
MNRAALPPGSRIGEMEILRVVASGGFGIVYLARDHSLDRDVAVKEFMPSELVGRSHGDRVTLHSISNAETFALGLRSFVNEAKLLARFSHPAMVKVYSFWEANGTAYMAMPYLRGPTLRDVRRSMSAPPTEAWLRSVIDPLLDALAMLHAEGFYHRDISPDNVLVSGAGLPVLLDFGAARRLIGDRTRSITAVLKPDYAPIEQYAESTQLRQGPWTDLYALGAVVAYLLDGIPPPASTARSIHDEMNPLGERQIPGVSRTFLSAIDWTLAVRPQDRPQSVAELQYALDGRQSRPARGEWRQPAASGEADIVPAASGAEPIAPTIRWNRPSSFGRHLALLSLVASAGAMVTAAVSWPMGGQPPNIAAALRSELAAQPPVTALVEAARADPPVTVLDAAVATVAVDPAAEPSMRAPAIARRTASVAKTHEPGAKARAASGQKVARSGKAARTRVASAGPLEICASRNFFMRPYCIQRQCDEPRFKVRPECLQSRQVARARHE